MKKNNNKTIKVDLSECSTQNPSESKSKNKKRIIKEKKENDKPNKK